MAEAEVIFTTQPGSEQYGINEMNGWGIPIGRPAWLDAGVGRAAVEGGFQAAAGKCRENPPVFIRHICPAQIRTVLTGTPDDLDRIAECAGELDYSPIFQGISHFPGILYSLETFSVQVRLLGGERLPYSPGEIRSSAERAAVSRNIPVDTKHPAYILSVTCLPGEAYLGLSRAQDNLSDWGGGACRFSREEGQISRAEFKLLEAIQLFSLQLPAQGAALDLGAAPGGWTRILRKAGMRVTAVDPALLHPSLAEDPEVTHIRKTAQEFFQAGERFDLIVNDMRMDARESAQIMRQAVKNLKPGGLAVMTLKLPEKGQQKITRQVLEILKTCYQVEHVRQLYHNRSEVTAVLRRP